MRDLRKLAKLVKRKLSMRPTLPLGLTLRVGSIGVIENEAFRHRGSTASILGVSPGKCLSSTSANVDWELTSGQDVIFETKAKGAAWKHFPNLNVSDVGVEISFESEDAFFLAARGVKITTLSEPERLLRRILDAYRVGGWSDEWVLVYEVATPASYTAILSEARGAKVALCAKGEVAFGTLSVGDLAAGFTLKSQTYASDQFVAQGRLPAFFNAYRVKKSFLRGPSITTAVSPDMIATGSAGSFVRV